MKAYSLSWIRCALLTFLATWSFDTASPSVGAEPRDRQWLLNYIRKPIEDSPRHQVYLKIIDQAQLSGLLDRKWLVDGEDSGKGRDYATLIGQMAFAYHTPGTRWHKNRELLAEICAGFEGFARHQNETGRFVWSKQQQYEDQAHEHAWRLEPLLLAYLWIEADLMPEQRDAWWAMLKRGGEYLLNSPITEANNRGAVWCVGTQLCGLAFEDERYFKLLERHAPTIMGGMLGKLGEVTETQGAGGPDGNYSYVGWGYAYVYRVLAGADDMDPSLVRSLRWLIHYATVDGSLLVPGAACRKLRFDSRDAGLLPALERYAPQDPFLAKYAEQYMKHIGDAGFAKHGITVHVLVWALLEKPATVTAGQPPTWYADHTQYYEWPAVRYLLVGRERYHTGVMLHGHFPARGMQTFAWGWERPILRAEPSAVSSTVADGVDTSRESIAKVPGVPGGRDIVLQLGEPVAAWKGERPVTMLMRQTTLWTCYAFTPGSMVVVYGGAQGPITSTWAMVGVEGAKLDATNHTVSAPQHEGRIFYLHGQAELKSSQEQPGNSALVVSVDQGPSAFGFSDTAFRFHGYDAERRTLAYTDAAGSYRLSLVDVVDRDGNLNRSEPGRLALDMP